MPYRDYEDSEGFLRYHGVFLNYLYQINSSVLQEIIALFYASYYLNAFDYMGYNMQCLYTAVYCIENPTMHSWISFV